MQKIIFSLLLLAMAISGCYSQNINNQKIDNTDNQVEIVKNESAEQFELFVNPGILRKWEWQTYNTNGITIELPVAIDDFKNKYFDINELIIETTSADFQDYAAEQEKQLLKEWPEIKTKKVKTCELTSESCYSYEIIEQNGVEILVHKRNFGAMIGNIYQIHLNLQNQKVLFFEGNEAFSSEIMDRVLKSISKVPKS
jgi:hypothetical protein